MASRGRYATLSAWSFSVYRQWLQCPFSVCLDKIQKVRIKEPDSPYLAHGGAVHKAADAFIGGTAKKAPKIDTTMGGKSLSSNLANIAADMLKLRTLRARVEQDWAFTRQWKATGWLSPDVWLRIKTDACADTADPPTVDIVDWKTGKVHDEHRQQRSIYALGGLQLVQLGVLAGGSKKTELTARHVYVDTGQSATEHYTMKDLAPLKREWEARTRDMMNDTEFAPRPSAQACKWCRFGKSKGGPCASEVTR